MLYRDTYIDLITFFTLPGIPAVFEPQTVSLSRKLEQSSKSTMQGYEEAQQEVLWLTVKLNRGTVREKYIYSKHIHFYQGCVKNIFDIT